MAALECCTLRYILGLPSTRPLHTLILLHVENKFKFKKRRGTKPLISTTKTISQSLKEIQSENEIEPSFLFPFPTSLASCFHKNVSGGGVVAGRGNLGV